LAERRRRIVGKSRGFLRRAGDGVRSRVRVRGGAAVVHEACGAGDRGGVDEHGREAVALAERFDRVQTDDPAAIRRTDGELEFGLRGNVCRRECRLDGGLSARARWERDSSTDVS
jgi:hypothetical protein